MNTEPPPVATEAQTAVDRQPLEPVEVDDVKVVAAGTALWLVAFLVLLPFHDRLAGSGREWWVWTALAGFGLGLLGVAVCRRRRESHARDADSAGRDHPAPSHRHGGRRRHRA